VLGAVILLRLAAALLEWQGLLSPVGAFFAPAMRLLGLPGEAALVLAASIFVNIYGAIAASLALHFDLRVATILAIMCLTAHDLAAESAFMKKTGLFRAKVIALRLSGAVIAALALNLLLPSSLKTQGLDQAAGLPRGDFYGMLAGWALPTLALAAKLALFLLAVTISKALLLEFGILVFLSRFFAPAMGFLGLPREASFPWTVANVLGLARGSSLAEGLVREKRIKPQEAEIFNYHSSLCHSLFEDSALCVLAGLSLFWVTVPRLILAWLAVWIQRARRSRLRRSFRVGTR